MGQELSDVLIPLLGQVDLELVDLEVRPGLVRVTVDRAGGVDLEALASANRVVSQTLDRIDPLPGRYTLEVTSPGVERRLRTPGQFARAHGETVSVRTLPGTTETRRLQGVLVASDDDGFVVEGPEVPGTSQRVPYDAVERARTVFEWGSGPVPSPSRGGGKARPGAAGGGRRPKTNATTGRFSTP